MTGLIASVVALVIAWAMAKKLWYAPILGVFGQGYWIWYALQIHEPGLLLCSGGFALIYVIAIPKWHRERRSS